MEPANPAIELVRFVSKSDILAGQRARDPELDGLVEFLSRSPESWQAHQNVYATTNSSLPPAHFAHIYQIRLSSLPVGSEYEDLRQATIRLIDYCSTHGEAIIQILTLNCRQSHYTVWCGMEQKQFHGICVMTGKSIPKWALEH